ncbi:MAG: YraN family protein [Roseburia sp.]|nr:YraN family protein [Roseburia sp.]
MNKRRIGKEKEELACDFLRQKGFEILAVNYWCRYSEIDIVAKEKDRLVFVEVKYRKNANCGESSYAVSFTKIKRICQCARYYICKEHVPPDTPMRFDVVAIDGDYIRHFVNAFETV